MTLKLFAAIVACRKIEGHWEVLLQDSETTISKFRWQGKQTKFPGGRGEITDSGFLGIARREFQQETGYKINDGVNPKVVYDVIDGNQHKKFFIVFVEEITGELRVAVILDGTSRLFPPYWVRVNEAGLERKIYKTHRPAFRTTRRHLNLMG